MSYPQISPFASGHVACSAGNEIYWEASGNPQGKPALYLHGGPGSGLGSGRYRSHFDPDRYFIIGIDQRGCGRSRPSAASAGVDLQQNTTADLISDIEHIRARLGVRQWLVSGVSWGSTLALAYAQAHPARVSELVLLAVTTTSRAEIDWITGHMGRIFPEAWERLEAASGKGREERLIKAYARRLAGKDDADRVLAARAWNEWESVHISLDPNFAPAGKLRSDEQLLEFATLVTHYWANDGFLRDGAEILNNMSRISHIPAVLIQGRRDISSPAITAWRLHRAWPTSRLCMVEEEGHGGPQSVRQMQIALDGFARGATHGELVGVEP